MGRLSYAPIAIKSNAKSYYSFRGMDRSRDITSMEGEEEQHFWLVENGQVDYRGQLSRDPSFFLHTGSTRSTIKTARFYNRNGLVWAEEDASTTHLTSDRGHKVNSAYSKNSVVSMTNFEGKVQIFSQGEKSYRYDGFEFSTSTASIKPAFGVAVQRRLVVAGFKDRPRVVELSRVDSPNIFLDEEPASDEASQAGFIDISNLIGTADEITGLGTFEANRLAIFTNDQTLVYILDPDFNQWSLDSRANLRIGCISHNTIVNAGSDLLFCSRRGIHSIMRSEQNGITISEASLSDDMERYYQDLLKQVENFKDISAVYDSDTQTYHVFFKLRGGKSERLSMNFRNGYEKVNFQTGSSLLPRCGAFLSGRLMFGTSDGLYESLTATSNVDTGLSELRRSKFVAETPVLWLGDFLSSKRCHTVIIQAFGKGRFYVDALDEEDRDMGSIEVNLDRLDGDPRWGDMPLSHDFSFPFNHVFRGVRLRFRTEETDTQSEMTIISFAFLTHKEK